MSDAYGTSKLRQAHRDNKMSDSRVFTQRSVGLLGKFVRRRRKSSFVEVIARGVLEKHLHIFFEELCMSKMQSSCRELLSLTPGPLRLHLPSHHDRFGCLTKTRRLSTTLRGFCWGPETNFIARKFTSGFSFSVNYRTKPGPLIMETTFRCQLFTNFIIQKRCAAVFWHFHFTTTTPGVPPKKSTINQKMTTAKIYSQFKHFLTVWQFHQFLSSKQTPKPRSMANLVRVDRCGVK